MIVVNGKSYSNLDEMPPDVRQSYEQTMGLLADKNQNGMPDIFEGMTGAGDIQVQNVTTVGSTQFVVEGKVYSSVDELPPEARQKYEQALAQIGHMPGDANQNGTPDVFESRTAAQPPTRSSYPPSQPLFAEPPTNNFDTTPNYRTALIAAVIVIVVLAVLSGLLLLNKIG
jgi:hypothetical protein